MLFRSLNILYLFRYAFHLLLAVLNLLLNLALTALLLLLGLIILLSGRCLIGLGLLHRSTLHTAYIGHTLQVTALQEVIDAVWL